MLRGISRFEVYAATMKNAGLVIDETLKDILGLKPKATQQELTSVIERFRDALSKSSLNPSKAIERFTKSHFDLYELVEKQSLNPRAVTKNEIVQSTENIFRMALDLETSATRAEIKEAIAALLRKVQLA